MPGKTNDYDKIANIYDKLSRLVFGSAIIDAQAVLLQHIEPGAKLLIAGGGTGWILELLAEGITIPLDITYVELSAKMIAIARRRNMGVHNVSFINSSIEEYISESSFDIVITAFLFDNFAADKAGAIFGHIDKMLLQDDLWLFSDFYIDQNKPGWRNKVLLKTMYIFFRIVCNIEASKLPGMHQIFAEAYYQCEKEYIFYKGFIRSAIYRKRQLNN